MRHFILLICLFWVSPCFAGWNPYVVGIGQSAASGPETLLPGDYNATLEQLAWNLWTFSTGVNTLAGQRALLSDSSESTYAYKAPGTGYAGFQRHETSTASCTGGTVDVYVRAKSSVASGDSLRLLLYDTTYRNSATDVSLTDSYQNLYYRWSSDPKDSSTWTAAKLNAYSFGWRDNTAHTGTITISDMWIVRTCP